MVEMEDQSEPVIDVGAFDSKSSYGDTKTRARALEFLVSTLVSQLIDLERRMRR